MVVLELSISRNQCYKLAMCKHSETHKRTLTLKMLLLPRLTPGVHLSCGALLLSKLHALLQALALKTSLQPSGSKPKTLRVMGTWGWLHLHCSYRKLLWEFQWHRRDSSVVHSRFRSSSNRPPPKAGAPLPQPNTPTSCSWRWANFWRDVDLQMVSPFLLV